MNRREYKKQLRRLKQLRDHYRGQSINVRLIAKRWLAHRYFVHWFRIGEVIIYRVQ